MSYMGICRRYDGKADGLDRASPIRISSRRKPSPVNVRISACSPPLSGYSPCHPSSYARFEQYEERRQATQAGADLAPLTRGLGTFRISQPSSEPMSAEQHPA